MDLITKQINVSHGTIKFDQIAINEWHYSLEIDSVIRIPCYFTSKNETFRGV